MTSPPSVAACLLTRAVLAGPPEHVAAHVADLTATLKQKLGMP